MSAWEEFAKAMDRLVDVDATDDGGHELVIATDRVIELWGKAKDEMLVVEEPA